MADQTPAPQIATGISYGATAKPEHAAQAVSNALENANLTGAASVLLFLTNGYAQEPKSAIKAAAKRASTVQVYGCTAAGLFTQQEWLLDVEGAVAMVFPSECALEPAAVLDAREQLRKQLPLLCLTSPQSSKIAINHFQHPMIGAISSNEYGQGDFPVWQGSRISKSGFLHASFDASLECHVGVSQGVKRLSPNLELSSTHNNCIHTIGGQPAADSLKNAIPKNVYDLFLEQPYHTLCAVSENQQTDGLDDGYFKLNNVVAIDEEENTVYLSGSAKQQRFAFWALRDRTLAKAEMKQALQELKEKVTKPRFAMMFNSISRGPYFFGERDCDLQLFQEYFPDVPMIGIYATGELSPGSHYAALSRRYASVVAIYSDPE